MKRSFKKLRLGTVLISTTQYALFKELGYSRIDIRSLIIENGMESLGSLYFDLIKLKKKDFKP
jgi:hypothetical protein